MVETLKQVLTPPSNPITKGINQASSNPIRSSVPEFSKPDHVYYSPVPGWKPTNDPNSVVVYIDKHGVTTGSSNNAVPVGINVRANTGQGTQQVSDLIAKNILQGTYIDKLGQPISYQPPNQQAMQNAINRGDIQGFSGKLLTDQEMAKAQLISAVTKQPTPQQYGEYFKATNPQGQQVLNANQNQLQSLISQPYRISPQEKINTIRATQPESGMVQPITANDLATLSAGVYAGVEGGLLLGSQILFSQPITQLNQNIIDSLIAKQDTGLAPSGFLPQVGRGGLFLATTPLTEVAYTTEIAKGLLTDPGGTVKGLYEYATKNPYEVTTIVAGGGLKVEDFKLPNLEIGKIEESIRATKDSIEVENANIGAFGERLSANVLNYEPGSLKVSYQIPFTPRKYSLDLLNNVYSKGELNIPPEFRQEKLTYEKIYSILKGANVEVGNLRLDRLKELPKDPETLQIIKDFAREKGLIVGGTTAIETLRINGKPLDLRRVPRDLELFDPLKRNAGSLAKELAKRLEQANKDIFIKGNTIGFKGIEGHGVNFQPIGGLNLERYRIKVYTNPEGIQIADPVSTAYNKVFDLLKTQKESSTKAKQLKQDNPEAYKKALFEGKVYVRYPKDVIGALSTAEQVIKNTLNKYKDFTQKQIPIVQEYKLLRFGQAKELIKPYTAKLKFEEAPIEPYYFKGQPANILSGIKYIDSYTLELERQLLKDVKASTKLKEEKVIVQDYYYLDKTGVREKLGVPKVMSTINYEKSITQPTKYPTVKYESYKPIVATSYPKIQNQVYPTSYPKVQFETYNSLAPQSYPARVQSTNYPKAQTYPQQAPTNYSIKIPVLPIITPSIPKNNRLFYYEEKRKIPQKKALGQGYNVYGKQLKSSKFFKINSTTVTRDRAEDIGGYYILNTLAKTFKISKAGRNAEDDFQFNYIPQGFYKQNSRAIREFRIRKGKPVDVGEVFIQKRAYGISSQGEKQQLKEFRRQVSRILR